MTGTQDRKLAAVATMAALLRHAEAGDDEFYVALLGDVTDVESPAADLVTAFVELWRLTLAGAPDELRAGILSGLLAGSIPPAPDHDQ